MTDELEFHPVADIFPMMSEREFTDLVDDIAENGLREPVWLHSDGRIIDGRNRYLACRKAGLSPALRTYDGDDSRLVSFVVSLNWHRRHLTDSQKAMAAARAEQYEQGRPRKDANLQVKRSDVAEMFKVSERSVASAKKVQESGVPELAEAVESGAVAVSTAAAIADAPEGEQREVIAVDDTKEIIRRANEIKRREKEKKAAERETRRKEAAEAASAAVAQIAASVPDAQDTLADHSWWRLGKHLLYCGDSTDPEFIEKVRGAKLAFADPPYNTGKADWDHGFEWAHDYLADAADITLVTPGISAIADFFSRSAMPYRWSMAAWVTNGMTRGAIGFGNWIYLAVFSHAESIHRGAQDHLRITVDSSTTDETGHESRKPARLLVDLINLFTAKGDLVVDPFLGSGTTLFAAEKTGRRCIGAEINPDYCREIIARYGPEARPAA